VGIHGDDEKFLCGVRTHGPLYRCGGDQGGLTIRGGWDVNIDLAVKTSDGVGMNGVVSGSRNLLRVFGHRTEE
jgi:hypothetical protein